MSASPSGKQLQMLAFMVEFAATPVYPAHTQIIRRWWPAERQSEGFRIVGTASRCGDVASKVLFGSLLSVMTWEHAALVGSAVALATAALTFRYHADSPHAQDEVPKVGPNLQYLTIAIWIMCVYPSRLNAELQFGC